MIRPAAVFVALLLAAPALAQGSLSPEQLAKLKAATVFVKVTVPGLGAGSGSGFVVKADAAAVYVVTNNHVVDLAFDTAAEGTLKHNIDVVFDSNNPTERTVKGTVVAADPDRDLAVLKLVGMKDPPAPLDIADAPKLFETMPVFIAGFPLGANLATGTKNPDISIGQGGVSSMRRDAAGRLAEVQLNAAVVPGNSGGPVVAADGKLVGVAVRALKAGGLGFAVPQQEVALMLRGRAGRLDVAPVTRAADGATVRLAVGIVDPFGTVTAAVAHFKPTADKDAPKPADPPKLLDGLTKQPLEIADGVASATVSLPGDATRILVQIEVTLADGTAYSVPVVLSATPPPRPPPTPGMTGPRPIRPREVRLPSGVVLPAPLPLNSQPEFPADAGYLSNINRAADKFADKFVEFACASTVAILPQGDKYEMPVELLGGQEPANIKVQVPKDLALQLADLGLRAPYKFAVRVNGKVLAPVGKDERFIVEVGSVAFLDGEFKPHTTFKPEAAAPTGPPTLAAVNRFPADFTGQSVTVEAVVKGVRFAGRESQLDVLNVNGAPALNLAFYGSNDLFAQVKSDLPEEPVLCRLTVGVERVDAKTGLGVVGVTKVEVPAAGAAAAKTLTGTGKIIYPPAAPAEKPKTPVTPAATPAAATPEKVAAPAKPNNALVIAIAVGVGLGVVAMAAAFFLLRKKAPIADAGDEAEPPAKPKYQSRDAAKAAPPAKPKATPPKPKATPPTADGGGFPGFDFEK